MRTLACGALDREIRVPGHGCQRFADEPPGLLGREAWHEAAEVGGRVVPKIETHWRTVTYVAVSGRWRGGGSRRPQPLPWAAWTTSALAPLTFQT